MLGLARRVPHRMPRVEVEARLDELVAASCGRRLGHPEALAAYWALTPASSVGLVIWPSADRGGGSTILGVTFSFDPLSDPQREIEDALDALRLAPLVPLLRAFFELACQGATPETRTGKAKPHARRAAAR